MITIKFDVLFDVISVSLDGIFVVLNGTKKLRHIFPVTIYCPLLSFYGQWFSDKGSKTAKARESNQMNLNTSDIVIVHNVGTM